MKVIGYARKSGTFNDRSYDNINFYTVSPVDEKQGRGMSCEVFKISSAQFAKVSQFSPDDLLQKEIEVYYDRFGHVNFIKLVK